MDTEFRGWLRGLPKIELHVHLEGAVSVPLALRLAEKNRISLDKKYRTEWERGIRFSGFEEFIGHFIQLSHCYRTPGDVSEIIREFLRFQETQNVRYCEVFFTPTLHHARKGIPYGDLIVAVEEGIKTSGSSVEMKLIADISRHSGMDLADLTVSNLEKHPTGRVIGLGLGGAERGFPPEQFKDHFQAARDLGLHCVAHAGETDGPESVRKAVEVLRVSRIGHGVRAAEDPEVLELLSRRNVWLEVCPTSNVKLGVFPSYETHPLRLFWERGLPVTLNSDDPTLFGTNLEQELMVAHDRFGFTREELVRLMLNSVRASFAPSNRKERLRKEVLDYAGNTGSLPADLTG